MHVHKLQEEANPILLMCLLESFVFLQIPYVHQLTLPLRQQCLANLKAIRRVKI